jgi:hypothetical protein
MASTIVSLTKNVWTKVLTNVTYYGSVHILDQDQKPTEYQIALVNTGDAAPAEDFAGGIVFDDSFAPSNSVASDYYVKPVDFNGSVVVLT